MIRSPAPGSGVRELRGDAADDAALAQREFNDLALKALHGLDAARRWVRDHPMVCLGVGGLVLSSLVVVAGGRVGAPRSAQALTSWLGLEDVRTIGVGDRLPGAIMFGGVVALILLWILAVEVVRRTRQPEPHVWFVAGVWALPFAVGPPLMDTGVYSYTAFGLVQRAGRDPYTSAATSLGDVPIVNAVDPAVRGVASSSGPLGSILQHLAVTAAGGNALAAVVVLRVLGVVAALMIGRLAADMGGRRAGEALAITALNPLVLFFVISSPHLEGVVAAVALAAIAAATQRRWTIAVALACTAGSITGQAFVLVPVVVVAHCLGRRKRRLSRVIAKDVAVAAVVTAAFGFLQPDGFGWLTTITKQFSVDTPFAIASAVGQVLSPVVRDASYDDLVTSGRVTAAFAALCTVVFLIATARSRALERTAGYCLLAIGLLSPSLYPWYVLPALACVAPTALGERRTWVLALSAGACVLMPAGFSDRTTNVLTGSALGLVAVATSVELWLEHRKEVAAAAPAEADAEAQVEAD